MRKLKQTSIDVNNTSKNIKEEDIIKKQNDNLFVKTKGITVFLDQLTDKSIEFQAVNGFVEDNEVSVIYYQWNVELYINEDLEDNLDFILPFINYEIVFDESQNNDINYYNSHNDLHTSYFYELRENLLILHVSFYIKKAYNGNDLIIPNAKLKITFRNPMQINN